MILVVGGTGTLGRALVDRLTAAGQPVRLLTRDPARVSTPAWPEQVEVVAGDVRDPASLAAAMQGATAVVSAAHGFLGGRGAGPEEIDHMGNRHLIRTALDASVRHFTLISVLDARPDHPMSLHRAKAAAERELAASGLSWTILRPSSYVETWIDIVGAKVPTGGPALVFGRGNNPINFISVRDVAAVTERALIDPDLRGHRIDLPGPENLTMSELARLLGAERIRRVPRAALRVFSAVLPPVAPAFARQTHAALVMDTLDMSADPSAFHERFPDIVMHVPRDVAGERPGRSRDGAPA